MNKVAERHRMPWTREEDNLIRAMHKAGYTSVEMAERLGRGLWPTQVRRHTYLGLSSGTGKCLRCKTELPVKPVGTRGEKQKFCSEYCQKFQGPLVYRIKCIHCGLPVVTHTASIKTCHRHRGKKWTHIREYERRKAAKAKAAKQ